jgi:hypothetical protein
MATSGETVPYAELERRGNRLAHFLRTSGLFILEQAAREGSRAFAEHRVCRV